MSPWSREIFFTSQQLSFTMMHSAPTNNEQRITVPGATLKGFDSCTSQSINNPLMATS